MKRNNFRNKWLIFTTLIFLSFGFLHNINLQTIENNQIEQKSDEKLHEITKNELPISQSQWLNISLLNTFEINEDPQIKDFERTGDILYIAAGINGIYVLNISDPVNPVLISRYQNDYDDYEISVNNDLIYVAECDSGLEVVNITDPNNLVRVSYFERSEAGYIYDVAVSGDYLYLASNDYAIRVVDLADLSSSTPQFTILNEISSTLCSTSIKIIDNFLYLGSRYDDFLKIYNISDFVNPVLLSTISNKIFDFSIQENLLYVSNFFSGLYIYNISVPYMPVEINYTQIYYPFSMKVNNDFLYIIGGNNQFFSSFNISNPKTPNLLWNKSISCFNIYLFDTLIYLTENYGDVLIYDSGFDTDEDGLSDGLEQYIYNSDPAIQDTDSDGLLDGEEVFTYATDPINNDTDADLLSDGDEISTYYTDPTTNDTDSDALTDWNELFLFYLDPTDDDFDDDGLDDGTEMADYISDNGLNGTEEELFAEQQTYAHIPDRDSDGLTDGQEVNTYHSDPNNNDSDYDGLFDGDEVQIYNTDPSMGDSDGDGIDDGIEIGIGLNPATADSDGDGLSDLKDFIANFGEEASATYFSDGFIQISYGTESIFTAIKTSSTLYSAILNEEDESINCEVKGNVGTLSSFTITLSDEGAQYAGNITIQVDNTDIEYNQSINEINGATILEFQFTHTGEIQIISIENPNNFGSISGYPIRLFLISIFMSMGIAVYISMGKFRR